MLLPQTTTYAQSRPPASRQRRPDTPADGWVGDPLIVDPGDLLDAYRGLCLFDSRFVEGWGRRDHVFFFVTLVPHSFRARGLQLPAKHTHKIKKVGWG